MTFAPFVVCELLCACFDWGRPSLHDDPLVGFQAVRPLFVLNDDEARYEIPTARQSHFRPESFAAAKPANEFRIFCLGGSTVQGRPFAIETSLTTWLELSLQAADAGRNWEVVNCGGISYAGYRLVPILREVLQYEPDLIVLYTGHNEFLEDRTYDHIKRRGETVNTLIATAFRSRTLTLAREAYLNLRGLSSDDPAGARPLLPAEVEALLDYGGGLEEYHRDEQWRSAVIAHYRRNLHRMVGLADGAGVELLLVNPVSNSADCPPFKSEHRADLSEEQQEEWASLCQSARQHFQRDDYDLHEAIRLLERACDVDDMHAGIWYALGQCYQTVGRDDQARTAYLRAKELDVCPLRILRPMNEVVLEVAAATGTPLVDAQALFERHSSNGIVGADWLLDHVHPGIAGHQLIADDIVKALVQRGVVHPRPDWANRKEQAYQLHLDQLGDLYFLKGTQRLEKVRDWARGRADLTPRPPQD